MVSLAAPGNVSPLYRLWRRDLDQYPTGLRRYGNLAIVVAVTIVLYYQLYVAGAVATQLLHDLHMSFAYYAGVLAVSNGIGAIASLATGIADRIGRANLAVFGTVITSVIAIWGIPSATTGLQLGVWMSLAGLVEGVILVATPALVRDFSPQVGRAQAMAFWTMGPVLGSLIVSMVTSTTLDTFPRWSQQFVISGVVGLVVAIVALVCLRELNAEMRSEVVGALEADTQAALDARGLDRGQAMRRPYRQMFTFDIVGSSLAISLFLLFYYTAVAFLPIYFQTVMGFTESQSNSLLNWLWGATAVSMLVVGKLSDRKRVRKPFMLFGGVMTVVIDVALLSKSGAEGPSFASIAVLLVISGVYSGAAYVPWMASFTETVERRNPALAATGLAIWGWILRLVIAASFVVLPMIVTTVTPLVGDGPRIQATAGALAAQHPNIYVEAKAHPEIFAQLGSYPTSADVPNAVLDRAIRTVGAPVLTELQKSPTAQAQLKILGSKAGQAVVRAQKDTAAQWKIWLTICTLGAVAFCPLVFLMAGAWRSRSSDDPRGRDNAVERAVEQFAAQHRSDDDASSGTITFAGGVFDTDTTDSVLGRSRPKIAP